MDFCIDICLFVFLLSAVYGHVKPVNSKDWLIEFHQPIEHDLAQQIAKRYAMVSRGPVGSLSLEYPMELSVISGVE